MSRYEARRACQLTQKNNAARVWRGKNLDMIVYGEDERRSWASKIGAFLETSLAQPWAIALDRGRSGGIGASR